MRKGPYIDNCLNVSINTFLDDIANDWKELVTHADTTYTMVKLTQHHIPEAKAFNLLGDDEETKVKPDATMDNSTNQSKLTRHWFAITTSYRKGLFFC